MYFSNKLIKLKITRKLDTFSNIIFAKKFDFFNKLNFPPMSTNLVFQKHSPSSSNIWSILYSECVEEAKIVFCTLDFIIYSSKKKICIEAFPGSPCNILHVLNKNISGFSNINKAMAKKFQFLSYLIITYLYIVIAYIL